MIRSLTLSMILLAGIGRPIPCAETTTPNSVLPEFKAMAATSQGVRSFSKADVMGHVWVADFVFTTCGELCPRMTRQMRKLQTRLPSNVLLVSFTIDPDRDTLEDLQGMARDVDADPNRWFFLRMNKKPLSELIQSGFRLIKAERGAYEQNSATLSHNSQFVVVDARGRVRAFYDGLQEDSLDLIKDAVDVMVQEK